MQSLTLPTSGSYSFTNCDWTDCSSSDAGAITFRDETASSLEVKQCTFTRCISSHTDHKYSGGAINAFNISSISICSSFFHSCKCTKLSGGGINLYFILHQPYVNNCDFVSCFAFDDGGGASLRNSTASDTLVCTYCRFVNGTSHGSDTSWAGGIILWNNNNVLQCSNILFESNTGLFGCAYGTNINSSSPDYPLRFCFFHGNTGTYGNDVCFRYYQESYEREYFISCFSVTENHRIQNYTSSTDYSNWLPQANINAKLTATINGYTQTHRQ